MSEITRLMDEIKCRTKELAGDLQYSQDRHANDTAATAVIMALLLEVVKQQQTQIDALIKAQGGAK